MAPGKNWLLSHSSRSSLCDDWFIYYGRKKNVCLVCQLWFMSPSHWSEVYHQGILEVTSWKLKIVTLSIQTGTLFQVTASQFNSHPEKNCLCNSSIFLGFDHRVITAKFVLQYKYLRDLMQKTTVMGTRT